MTNHPHDCPVCDEGGECHLQDMTVMTGHNYRRFEFKKRTHQNQYLGPFINHEMNRCIQCYRCIRFYRDYAGGRDLAVFSSRNHVYFGKYEAGILENEFSGNLVEVCPTGVFTDKTLKKHFTRKWDLTNAPSLCVHCSAGCNIIAGERYGKLRRIMSRYNGAVNGYFICDRGRFGYEFVNGDKRVLKAQLRAAKHTGLTDCSREELSAALATALSGQKKIIGIGSPRASLEANFALQYFVGSANFYHGVSENDFRLVQTALRILKQAPAHSPSLKEIEKSDAVLILGEDVTNTAPMVALAVRQAIRNKGIEQAMKSGIPVWNANAQIDWAQDLKNPVFLATSYKTKLEDIAEKCFYGSPQDIARLGFAVAANLNSAAPVITNLEPGTLELSNQISEVLRSADNPLIITGTHSGSEAVLQAAANVASALALKGKKVSICMLSPECNSMGLAMMHGNSLRDAILTVEQGEADTVIILENDLYRRIDKESADLIFEKCSHVIVMDHLVTRTAGQADILMPVGTFAGSEGTLVSQEGRAQRFYRVFPFQADLPESWRCLGELMVTAGKTETSPWKVFDELSSAMSGAIPAFAKISGAFPASGFNMYNEKIRRQTIRFSGRTAMNAQRAVSEPKPPADPDSPLAFSMEGANEQPPSSLVPFYWAPGWNSGQAVNFYLDEPAGSLKGGDPGIRLIEKNEDTQFSFFETSSLTFVPEPGKWLFVPVYRIFGSEELSSEAPAIREMIPEPFVLLNQKDMDELKLANHQLVKVEIDRNIIEAKVRIDNDIAPGIAGLSAGLPDMPFLDLPGWGTIKI
jgi:NADH-quinone oxidoreductase subunit G